MTGSEGRAPTEKPVALAIIIVSYNVRELLRACLRATLTSLAGSPGIDAQVWVVDNASSDGSATMIAAEYPQVRLIASETNLGFAAGNNVALRELGYGGTVSISRPLTDAMREPPEFVLLLNPDAEPQGDAIWAMWDFLRNHPRVGGAGARLAYPDGRFQHGAFAFPGLLQLWFDLFPPRPRRLLESRLNGRYPLQRYEAGSPFRVGFALGAALMVRSEAILEVGLLDEGYFMYAEEVDWCWRMQRAGWSFFCVPQARVVHHGGASASQFRSRSFVNLWRSRHRLYRRFYGPMRRYCAGLIVRFGMASEIRRVRDLAARGDIPAGERDERIAAVEEVIRLFAESDSDEDGGSTPQSSRLSER